jgi:HSP20 family protein
MNALTKTLAKELGSRGLTVNADAPGFIETAMSVALPEENREKYVRVERQYGPFQRSFTIGVSLQQDRVTASYTDGVLEIHLPKAEEVKPKRVEVKVGR